MSRPITPQQFQKLEELDLHSFSQKAWFYHRVSEEIVDFNVYIQDIIPPHWDDECDDIRYTYRRAITVPEALDMFRERGTLCAVEVRYSPVSGTTEYVGVVYSASGMVRWRETTPLTTYAEAESELLTLILDIELDKINQQ